MTVEIEGADRLAATLADAAAQLDDLTGLHTELGELIVAAAGPLTPRRTRALAAATTAIASRDTTVVTNGLRYARPVHALYNPWLATAAKQTEARQLDLAEKNVQTILDTVQGL